MSRAEGARDRAEVIDIPHEQHTQAGPLQVSYTVGTDFEEIPVPGVADVAHRYEC